MAGTVRFCLQIFTVILFFLLLGQLGQSIIEDDLHIFGVHSVAEFSIDNSFIRPTYMLTYESATELLHLNLEEEAELRILSEAALLRLQWRCAQVVILPYIVFIPLLVLQILFSDAGDIIINMMKIQLMYLSLLSSWVTLFLERFFFL